MAPGQLPAAQLPQAGAADRQDPLDALTTEHGRRATTELFMAWEAREEGHGTHKAANPGLDPEARLASQGMQRTYSTTPCIFCSCTGWARREQEPEQHHICTNHWPKLTTTRHKFRQQRFRERIFCIPNLGDKILKHHSGELNLAKQQAVAAILCPFLGTHDCTALRLIGARAVPTDKLALIFQLAISYTKDLQGMRWNDPNYALWFLYWNP